MKSGWLILAFLGLAACHSDYTPKPRGYFRIEPPAAEYVSLPPGQPYTFLISKQASQVSFQKEGVTLAYPELRAKLYCSYFHTSAEKLDADFEESRDLVARQAEQADGIRERAFSNPDAQVYGLLFLIDGQSAAPLQFALTDSVSRFFRGALYYDCPINADSLLPVTRYLQADVEALIESFRWEEERTK